MIWTLRQQPQDHLAHPTQRTHGRLLGLCVLGVLLSIGAPGARAGSGPYELAVFGAPNPGGNLSLEFRGDPGAPVLLALGIAWADPAFDLEGRELVVDISLPWFVLSFGALPASGNLVVSGPLPFDPTLLGIDLVFQAATPVLGNGVAVRIRTPDTIVEPAALGEGFGKLLFTGFLDADGFGDFAVGALQGDNGAGEVWITYGPGTTPTRTLVDPTPQNDGNFGGAFGLADWVAGPDLDLAVGAFGAGPLTADWSGEVWIFEGPDFVNATQLLSPTPEANSIFGIQIEGGDFDGDGSMDMAVGQAAASVGGAPMAGKVHIFSGPLLDHTATLTRPGSELPDGAQFGFALAAGNLDGDDKDDLLVGAPAAIVSGIVQVGEAWVFHGPLSGPPVLIRDIHPTGGSAFGWRVKLADIVGDARLDVIVGNPGGAGAVPLGLNIRVGEAQIFDGGDPLAGRNFDDPTPEGLGHFGFEVSAGDVNGDGHADLLVGTNLADLGGVANAGEVFVYLGPALNERHEITQAVPSISAMFGSFLGAVDLDADGRDEIIIVAAGAGDGQALVVDF